MKGNKTVDNKFLYYVLSDNNFFNYSTVTSKGTKMPRGSKNAIMKYWVPDLDLPTQRKIADILSSYDELIKANNERIELLEQVAQELYREWFVRFRFPGHENAMNSEQETVEKMRTVFNRILEEEVSGYRIKDTIAEAIDYSKRIPDPAKRIVKDRLFYRCANTILG